MFIGHDVNYNYGGKAFSITDKQTQNERLKGRIGGLLEGIYKDKVIATFENGEVLETSDPALYEDVV